MRLLKSLIIAFLFSSALPILMHADSPEICLAADEQPHDSSQMQTATESYETTFIKTIIILALIIGLAIFTVWMFKKISHGRLRNFNHSKLVKVIEKRPLSPKSMLYLIEIGGKQVLIAESQVELRMITELDWMKTDKDL